VLLPLVIAYRCSGMLAHRVIGKGKLNDMAVGATAFGIEVSVAGVVGNI
jgi:hypothetical protein